MKVANRNWHKYLRAFCDGLGTTDPAQVSNASYIGKELFKLWMPGDYEREGKAGVFSPTVIREVYLLDLREWKPSGGPREDKAPKELKVGQLLFARKKDEVRLASVYLALNGRPASPVLERGEELAAKRLVKQLKRENSELR